MRAVLPFNSLIISVLIATTAVASTVVRAWRVAFPRLDPVLTSRGIVADWCP